MKTTEDRFWEKVTFEPMSGCWLWLASTRDGYGQFYDGYKGILAHRYSYQLSKGEIPIGLALDHLCRNRSCVNPDHLRAVSLRDNIFAPGSLALAKGNAMKTRCPKCNGEFTISTKNRSCKPCGADLRRVWKEKNRQHVREMDAAYYQANRIRLMGLQRERYKNKIKGNRTTTKINSDLIFPE